MCIRDRVTICVSTTKNFFVLNISRNGPQRNFSVQGIMMSDVHRAICASPIPSPLNINTETIDVYKRQVITCRKKTGFASLSVIPVAAFLLKSKRMYSNALSS